MKGSQAQNPVPAEGLAVRSEVSQPETQIAPTSNQSARFTQLLQKHSIAMNYTEGSSWEKVLGGFMDLTGVPVGFTAEGLRFILDNLQAGSAVLGVGAGGAFVGAGHKLYKGLKANPLGKKRQEELSSLKENLEEDIARLKELYLLMDQSATLPQFKDKSSGTILDSKAELRKQIENSHPSSKLLKAMSKFEAKMARSESLNSGPSQRQVELVSILNKAIDDELKRLEKLQHTDVGQKTGLSKLITQLNNWFKDIMLSFRESKLQGLKHLAFAFGEVLLGIGAIVATIAAFVVALPVMTASLGVNIATRAANFMAGVCVGLFAALYKICAVLNGSVGLFYNDSKAEEFHRNASKTKGEMINLMKEFFKKAFENPKASIDNAKDKAEKIKTVILDKFRKVSEPVAAQVDLLAVKESGQGVDDPSYSAAGLNLSRSEGDV